MSYKCRVCKGCTKIVRSPENTNKDILVYFCGLCKKAYMLHQPHEEVLDKDMMDKLYTKYIAIYGNRL